MSKHSRPIISTDIQELLNPKILKLVQEYCSLATLSVLSELEAARMSEILNQAESNGSLDFWINEADHFIAHELELTDEASIRCYEDQQARLREYLETQIAQKNTISAAANNKLNERIQEQRMTTQVQSNLKNLGLYPGKVDGIYGPITQAALKQFQEDHHLKPHGFVDQQTQMYLGL